MSAAPAPYNLQLTAASPLFQCVLAVLRTGRRVDGVSRYTPSRDGDVLSVRILQVRFSH